MGEYIKTNTVTSYCFTFDIMVLFPGRKQSIQSYDLTGWKQV